MDRKYDQIPGSQFAGEEWQLFRSYLPPPRDDLQNGAGGALANSVQQYPWNGPSAYNSTVGTLGTANIEYLPRNLPAGNVVLTVSFDINIPLLDANQVAYISVLPIRIFANGFANGLRIRIASIGWGSGISRYSFLVNNFQQCDRVALILNGVNSGFGYNYAAEITLPPPGTPMPPCFLQ